MAKQHILDEALAWLQLHTCPERDSREVALARKASIVEATKILTATKARSLKKKVKR